MAAGPRTLRIRINNITMKEPQNLTFTCFFSLKNVGLCKSRGVSLSTLLLPVGGHTHAHAHAHAHAHTHARTHTHTHTRAHQKACLPRLSLKAKLSLNS